MMIPRASPRSNIVLAMPDPTKLGPNPPQDPPHDLSEATPESAPSELLPEDFYYEGPYLVFTATYHLKRGYCCNSNCRHCPYK
jgi:hypothetical protein